MADSELMTILFCSCDKYKDLWNPFFTIMEKRWAECKFPIIINTETEKYESNHLNISCLSLYGHEQNVSYGKRMIDHIKRINTPYIMLVLDDFFLRSDVNIAEINRVLKYMESNTDVSSIRLTPYQNREAYNRCKEVEGLEGYYWMPQCSGYKLNFQVCIWRTESLLSYWREDDDPWKWEVFANITTFNDKGFIIVGEKIGPLLDYGYKVDGQPLSDVYRGKWVRENGVEQLFDEYGIKYDFSKRGFYCPSTEVKHFRNINIVTYTIRRIGFFNFWILLNYIFNNTFRKVLHLTYKPLSEYPSAFSKIYK